MLTTDQTQEELSETFKAFEDGFEQYAYLISLAGTLPKMDDDMKNWNCLVKGCQSRVWLNIYTENGLFYFDGDSDTLIIKGILALLRILFNGRDPEEVYKTKVWFLEKTDILLTFNDDRQKGIGYIIKMLQTKAKLLKENIPSLSE